ncbi:MAG: metallophosphoesterase family protein [Butyrivibrio sp.]
MKIYSMSDIHGCLQEFEAALEMIDLSGQNKLILLGDYVHSGPDSYGVLRKIMSLQQKYGNEKVIALMGNHEDLVIRGTAPVQELFVDGLYDSGNAEDDDYIIFMQNLPLYHVEGNIVFVHAGINEEAGEEWEWESTDRDYLEKFPPDTGHFDGEMTIVAGHVGTSIIADNPKFHDIYFDGESHYYIDATVYDSGYINVLMYDTEEEKFYQIIDGRKFEIEPYEECI